MMLIRENNTMRILKSAWIRGLTGIATAGLIITGATILFPMTGTNLAGHILGWIMAGFIGIKITLSAFEEEEGWMEGTLETANEVAVKMPSFRGANRPAVDPIRYEHHERFAGRFKEEPVLAHPGRLDRSHQVIANTAFHKPECEEKEDCIRFAAQKPICSLATIDEKDSTRPHVRTIFLWRADDRGFYFVLFSSKSVSRQVKAHPDVELCFQNHPRNISDAKQLRVHGHLGLLENRELREQASNDRSILNTLAGDGKDANIEVYLMSDYEMKFWQMGTMMQQVKAQTAVS
jgi:uncharacterized pyridoxamine 5'-phosphate oxidase family protein